MTLYFPYYSYLARTTVEDVARVEGQTYICSERREDTVPTPKDGIAPILGNWKSPQVMDKELTKKFTGCMKGNVYRWLLFTNLLNYFAKCSSPVPVIILIKMLPCAFIMYSIYIMHALTSFHYKIFTVNKECVLSLLDTVPSQLVQYMYQYLVVV